MCLSMLNSAHKLLGHCLRQTAGLKLPKATKATQKNVHICKVKTQCLYENFKGVLIQWV